VGGVGVALTLVLDALTTLIQYNRILSDASLPLIKKMELKESTVEDS
jgi:hypothetical protein